MTPQPQEPSLSLDTVVPTAVAGSDFKARLGDFIRFADENAFVARKNTELLLKALERQDGRLAAVERQLKEQNK